MLPDRLLASKEIASRIWQALDRLPFDQKTAVVLREVDGLRYDEIAFSLGIAVGTVKSRLTRARQALRAELLGLQRMIRYVDCDFAQPRLDAFVDGELPMGDQVLVESHLRWCTTCAARVEDLQIIGARLRAQPRPPRSRGSGAGERDLAAMRGRGAACWPTPNASSRSARACASWRAAPTCGLCGRPSGAIGGGGAERRAGERRVAGDEPNSSRRRWRR